MIKPKEILSPESHLFRVHSPDGGAKLIVRGLCQAAFHQFELKKHCQLKISVWMTFKISFLLQHLIKSRIEKGQGGGLILSVGGVREFFFFSFQRVTAGHGCCLGEVIYSPVGAVSWSLQHPQTGFPNEDDAVALSFRLESGLSVLMHSHIGIKAPALGKPLHLLFEIPPRSPVNERRSVPSEPLPAHADLRAGAHVANEVRPH